MNKISKKKVQPEQKLNSEQKADDKQVSPAIGNAHVIGGQVLNEYSVILKKKAESVGLDEFLKFIMSCMENEDWFCDWFDMKYRIDKETNISKKIDGGGFYLDVLQIRALYSLMSSNANCVIPSVDKTAETL